MTDDKSAFKKLKETILKEKKILKELNSMSEYFERSDKEEREIISSQIKLLRYSLQKANSNIPKILERIHLLKTLPPAKQEIPQTIQKIPKQIPAEKTPVKKGFLTKKIIQKENVYIPEENFPVSTKYSVKDLKPKGLEKESLKRMKIKKEKVAVKKKPKPNPYVTIANQWFSKLSNKILGDKSFKEMERDLIKANLRFTPQSYISVVLFSTLISVFAGILIMLFFLFFSIEANLPIILRTTETFGTRFLKVFWIPIIVPIATFFIMYLYPSLEKSSAELRINEELPFATIHMSAISGSMIDPSKIFSIIISTNEYPYLEKEFKKLINEINIYGYDIVSALRNSASNSPSKKLSELFNGLATTINSGGDLPEFFDKRAQTLLFEYGLEKEKKTKAAETFMDIYISVVIAAPMILMILLMMMKISGLGISMSTGMISLIMVLAVTTVNIVFLTFLHLKK